MASITAPKPAASTPSVTGEELALAKATDGIEKRIWEASEEELTQVLRYLMALTGLRPRHFPSPEETIFLLAYLRGHFGGHTLAETRLAFDMAVQGKLDIDPDDVKVYDSLSVIYVSRILVAYRKWAAPAVQRLRQLTEVPQRVYTEREKLFIHMDYVAYLTRQYAQRLLPPLKPRP